MKKHLIIVSFIINFVSANGQNEMKYITKIKADSLNTFVLNLKSEILNDTLKFDQNDLIALNGQTENIKQYSKLYLVDMKYFYRLDVIDNKKVKEFVTEIVDSEKIEVINISKNNSGSLVFGKNAKNGCVFITTKKKYKINYKVAGLKYYRRRKMGHNFDQIKKGDIMIRT